MHREGRGRGGSPALALWQERPSFPFLTHAECGAHQQVHLLLMHGRYVILQVKVREERLHLQHRFSVDPPPWPPELLPQKGPCAVATLADYCSGQLRSAIIGPETSEAFFLYK
eukprot:COSAG01_NODE_38443_length_489_cov_1.374359_2_plen_112_part_01